MKQFYKVLLMLFFCFYFHFVHAADQSITMSVGETKTYSYWSLQTNQFIDWQVIGDEVALVYAPNPSGMDFWGTDYHQPRIIALKPGKCIIIGTKYVYNNYSQLQNIDILKLNITVTGYDPQTMVMQHHLHLGLGQEHTLSPRLLPSGTSSTLTWYSSNTNVATVSDGKITAKAVGDATITCITENGLREDCEVTVTPTMVSNLSLNQDQLQMSIGDTYQFSTAIAPENATYKQVTWTSMNPDVVSVDNNGLMSCLSNGWSVILATTVDGSNLTAGCFVQVGASEGGDVNGDGVISIKDVTELIDRLLRG